jgi:hypothetical protein
MEAQGAIFRISESSSWVGFAILEDGAARINFAPDGDWATTNRIMISHNGQRALITRFQLQFKLGNKN